MRKVTSWFTSWTVSRPEIDGVGTKIVKTGESCVHATEHQALWPERYGQTFEDLSDPDQGQRQAGYDKSQVSPIEITLRLTTALRVGHSRATSEVRRGGRRVARLRCPDCGEKTLDLLL
jgi:hypothetical protein